MEKIIKEIQQKLMGQNNLIAIALNNAINENQDDMIMLSNIREMAKDNYRTMLYILGKPLLTDIINFKS